MLTLWTTTAPNRVRAALSSILPLKVPVHITKDIATSPPETSVIVACGSVPFKQLQEEKVVAKNRAITSYRTIPQMRGSTPLLVSYSADIGEIDHGYYVDLLTDVTLALRYCQTGQWKPKLGQYRYVTDFSALCKQIKAQHEFTEEPVDVAMDLETLGLDPYAFPTIAYPGAYIVTIQATCEHKRADVIRFMSRQHETERLADPVLREQLEFLLHCPYIRLKGADFKYDLHWLWKRGGFTCNNFAFDTTIVGSLLDENRSNGLDVHAKVYVPLMAGYSDAFDATVDKARIDQVPPETLLPYAGGDVDATLQVADVEKVELLKDPKLARFYVTILRPACRAFEEIEQGGIVIDKDAYEALRVDLTKEHLRLVKEACMIMGGRIVFKHQDERRLGGMNLTKASMLCDYLFSPMGLNLKPRMYTEKPDKDGIQKPSTAMEHLLMFEDVPEAKAFVNIIKQDQQVMKTHDTYVEGFLEHLRSDGRYHPTFFLFVGNRQLDEGGAKTGRLSAKGPAFQVLPKHTAWAKPVRRCFIAPPGYVVVERDYNQGELRVVACIANETNMIAAYKAGRDLHIETAAPFAGYTYESFKDLEKTNEHLYSETRQLGKAGNFGLVFGMHEKGFTYYAKDNYGVDLTPEQAHEFRTTFFKRYPQLLVYHDAIVRTARREKMVRTPLGRLRHLPLIDSPNKEVASKAERQAINSPVQGTLTDMVLWVIALEHQSGLSKIAPCFGACHDSIYNYVPEDQVDLLLPQMLETMQNLPFKQVGWTPQLQFTADAKVGPTMGDMQAFVG
jgi:DNA polymerase I-like protein with 3'-5' exonuclease and polymerase domains